MASNIDATQPPEGSATTAAMRANMTAAKMELEKLQESKIASAYLNPKLKHFFSSIRLSQGSGLIDAISGLTITPANNVLSAVNKKTITVAPANSGLCAISGPLNLSGNKPFLIMAMYSNTASGALGGFHFSPVNNNQGGFELWNGTNFSSSLIADGISTTIIDSAYADGAGKTDVAVAMLASPGDEVIFMYAGPNGYWEENAFSMAAIPVFNPVLPPCQPISNATNGVRDIYGLLIYEFDIKPPNYKAGIVGIREEWLKGSQQASTLW